jgi:hypothetical protein
MRITLIVDGASITVIPRRYALNTKLIEITRFSDKVRAYIPSEIRAMDLEGFSANGEDMTGEYRVHEKLEGDVYVVTRIERRKNRI